MKTQNQNKNHHPTKMYAVIYCFRKKYLNYLYIAAEMLKHNFKNSLCTSTLIIIIIHEKLRIICSYRIFILCYVQRVAKILYVIQQEIVFLTKELCNIENHRDENFEINSPVGIIGTQYMRMNNLF